MSSRSGVFETWQPRYATHGVATFPVRFEMRDGKIDKIPAVKGYMKLGLRGSTDLTRRFADADGIGLALGGANRLIAVDIDTPDENAVADVLACHGQSPLIARTPSGGHHVFYRHDGRQHRRVRHPYWRERNVPVDVLGNGFVVAPPSLSPKGIYEFVEGQIDDIARLPIMRAVPGDVDASHAQALPKASVTISKGRRNTELWRHCMRQAKAVASFAELLDEAHRFRLLSA
jgi:hypothetical protein